MDFENADLSDPKVRRRAQSFAMSLSQEGRRATPDERQAVRQLLAAYNREHPGVERGAEMYRTRYPSRWQE